MGVPSCLCCALVCFTLHEQGFWGRSKFAKKGGELWEGIWLPQGWKMLMP